MRNRRTSTRPRQNSVPVHITLIALIIFLFILGFTFFIPHRSDPHGIIRPDKGRMSDAEPVYSVPCLKGQSFVKRMLGGWYEVLSDDPEGRCLDDGVISNTFSPVGDTSQINSFEDCARAGYPIAESYPRLCYIPGPNGRSFNEPLPRASQ